MLIDVDQHLRVRQMRRKSPVVAIGTSLPARVLVVLCGVQRGLVRSDGLLQVLQCQLQLVRAQLFRAPAELLTQQTPYQQLQLVDFDIALLHSVLQSCVLLFSRDDLLAQHLQRGRIVKQSGDVIWHVRIMITAAESAPMTLV